ncbi:transcriptional regulator [Sphingomonas sp. MMS24-J13]|uniref:winged helix-turn-helix domain-containing protein n=1 Tax=Sphingomonas sp. MMS24-J13 TaxID=3238686 RepID=UPI003850E62E
MVDHYQIGRWHFDPAEPILRDGSAARRLEDRAARTLELLCRRRGEVVGKDELIDAVWQGRSVSANSVAVVVGHLRRALGDDPAAPRYIVTINKRGYRLTPGAQLEPGPSAPRRRSWPGSPIMLLTTVILLGVGVLLLRPSPRPVDLVVDPVLNDTGASTLEPLAKSLSAVMIDGAVRIDGGRVVPRAVARDGVRRRLAIRSRLIIWNGAPELAMSATDLDSGSVVWSGFAAGPTGALARNTAAKLATLGPALRR